MYTQTYCYTSIHPTIIIQVYIMLYLFPSAKNEKQNSGLITTKPGYETDRRHRGDSPVTQSKSKRLEVVVARQSLPSGV